MNYFESAFKTINSLISTFEENINYYTSVDYQELEVRSEFIDKFFIALGWDVNHDKQKNPHFQEVKIEKRQYQKGSIGQKRADYSFSLSPNYKQPKFFVEAKKPSRTLRKNRDDYFQTAKYGWNAGTGISILTDFEELIVIDCRFKPDIDTITSSELKYYHFANFKDEDKFNDFYWLFSHEAIEAGNIERYIEDLPKQKGTGRQLKLFGGGHSIDESFLNYIDEKRQELAKAFFENNKTLDAYSLTEAILLTLDRIVFIRFLEDKLIEQDSIINKIANTHNAWAKFIEYCKILNVKYNGIVFKSTFIDNPDFLGADENLFCELCSEIDNTNSPYDFNYIPIHILGNIYERFLGKVVTIVKGKVIIEQKPEVRKAGGVFYTPKYIVDFIVKNTVGEIIKDKTPKQIEELTFADISCGSGSFLIGAFEYLLDYHISYYNEHPEQAKKAKCKFDDESGTWVLSIKQKQKILLNNIYGVDIDLQATEVTQLSLFLKMLEDETTATTNDMMVLFHETILPNLSNNIMCGNSLIGTEILTTKLDLDLDAERSLNPFDFDKSFSKVFEKGGFDLIIGNPPYVKEYTERKIFENVREGKLEKYYQGKMDLWYFFVCYGIDILKDNGFISYIAPNNWVSNSGASKLRNKIIRDTQILGMYDFKDFMVFKDASIQTMVFNLQKSKAKRKYSFIQQTFIGKKLKVIDVKVDLENQSTAVSKINKLVIEREKNIDTFLKFNETIYDDILNKIIQKKNFVLDKNKEVAQGIVSPQDSVNKKSKETLLNKYSVGEGIFVLSNGEKKGLKLSKDELKIIKPYYTTDEIRKYYVRKVNSLWIIYTDSSFKNIRVIEKYPNIKSHLDKFKKVITSDNKPYGLHRAREEKFFTEEKIICLRKCTIPTFSYCDFDCYVSQTFNIIRSERIDLKYLTGALNSNLIKFWLLKKGKMQGSLYQVDKEPILQIPIFKTTNQTQYKAVINCVEQLINAKKQLEDVTTERDTNYLMQKINNCETILNKTVYQIYEITQDEINIIEGCLK